MNKHKEEGIFIGIDSKNSTPISFEPFNDNISKNYNKIFLGKQGRGMNYKIKQENEEVDEKL